MARRDESWAGALALPFFIASIDRRRDTARGRGCWGHGYFCNDYKVVWNAFCAPPLYQVEWLNGEELRDRVTRLTCRSFFQNDYGLDRGIN